MDKKTQITCLSFIQQFILMQNLRLAFFQSLNSSLSSDWLGPGDSSLNFWQYLLNCQMEIPTPTFGVLKDQSLSLPSLPHLEPSGALCAPCPCSSYSMIEGGEGVLAPAIGSLWYSVTSVPSAFTGEVGENSGSIGRSQILQQESNYFISY